MAVKKLDRSGLDSWVDGAILTDERFDAAATVDLTSATFGRRGDETEDPHCSIEDVDGDGDQDVICHFRMQKTGLLAEDRFANLRARTVDGTIIGGVNSIRIGS